MNAEFYQALSVIVVMTISCAILSPLLWWLLPDRTRTVESA